MLGQRRRRLANIKTAFGKITHIHQPYRNRQKIYLFIVTKFLCKTFDSWYPCCAYNFLKSYKKRHYVTSSLLRWFPSHFQYCAVLQNGRDDKTQSTLAHISPLHYPFCNKLCADKRAVGDVGILASDQFQADIHPLPQLKTLEAISECIRSNSFHGFVVCLCRLQTGTCLFFMIFKIY